MDPQWLIDTFGDEFYWFSLLIIAVECGLFPFLPGDSLLFAIGLFIAGDHISVFPAGTRTEVAIVVVLFTAAATLGNVAGYEAGRLAGPWLLRRDGRLFNQRTFDQVEAFFDRYGTRALVIGRFIPYVRTYITVAAGVTRMDRRRFALWSLVGAVAWVGSLTLFGYLLGTVFPLLGDNPHAALVTVVAFTLVPVLVEWVRHRRTHAPGAEIGPHDGGPDRDITGRDVG